MKYAVVRNNIVENIIECGNNGVIALEKVMNCTLVPCEEYRVQNGDTYADGVFKRGEEFVERIKTADEKINELKELFDQIQSRLESAESAVLGLMNLFKVG